MRERCNETVLLLGQSSLTHTHTHTLTLHLYITPQMLLFGFLAFGHPINNFFLAAHFLRQELRQEK